MRAILLRLKQLSIRLSVQLVENNTVNIEALLAVRLGGKHLIEAVGRHIHDVLLRGQDFDALVQRRTHPHHIGSDIKHDCRLLPISSTAVYFGTFLVVAARQKQCDRSGKLGLAVLLGNFNVRRIELPVAV